MGTFGLGKPKCIGSNRKFLKFRIFRDGYFNKHLAWDSLVEKVVDLTSDEDSNDEDGVSDTRASESTKKDGSAKGSNIGGGGNTGDGVKTIGGVIGAGGGIGDSLA
ncbi:hypothetical protein Tco_1227185 [Tanacetum coccineum]